MSIIINTREKIIRICILLLNYHSFRQYIRSDQLLKILEKLLSKKVNADMLFLSELLTYKGESQILLVNYFDQVVLDYSLHSLTFIDEYLLLIRQYFIETNLKKLNEEEHQHFIQDIVTISLRIGAYVGETIRENDQKQQWY